MVRHLHGWLFCMTAVMGCCLGVRAAEVSLADRVDALIRDKAQGQSLAPAADDEEFLRRVWLDFDGGVPSATEARAFLDNKAADKRTRLIDQLIAAPRFAERMADSFHVMLMERRGENAEWRAWLLESFRANKPWDVMVGEMLAPDFLNEKQRGSGYFMTRRLEKVGQQDTDYPGLTRDVGRLFMGVDLQCCQCHNHRTVGDYKQGDFSGLFTVYQNLKLQPTDSTHKTAWLSEGLISTKYEYTSVLTSKKGLTGPRVPFSEEDISIPVFTGDEGWLAKPDRKTKEVGKPKFSPLHEIAARLPTPDNAFFARNIANRVWFLLMGRGLVEPLDFQHSDNPPSHPELLDLLAKEITAHHFDLRWLIRELAQTEVYQRSSAVPAEARPELFVSAQERHLTAEQQLRAFLAATGDRELLEKIDKADAKDDSRKYSLADFKKAFADALANPAKEPELKVNPSLRSALFFRNGDQIQWALKPRPGNLVDRLSAMTDGNELADELYLSVLTRRPSADEKSELAAWLSKQSANKSQALTDIVWAMISSTEFFVNH
jgi:hypothetical protein